MKKSELITKLGEKKIQNSPKENKMSANQLAPTKLTPDDVDWRKITFRECGVHPGLLFACEKCPVCERDEAIEELHKIVISRQDHIESLEMTRATSAAE